MSGPILKAPAKIRQRRLPAICTFIRVIGSLLFWAYFFAATLTAFLVIGLIRLVLLPADSTGYVAHRLTSRLSYHFIGINPLWQIAVEAAELDRTRHYVLVANHQSLADVLVLSRLNMFFKWVAKAQVLNMPGVGQLMHVNGYIPVAHGDLRSVRRMLRRARTLLNRGVSVFIFPEGERSFDGALLPFKDGPFKLACNTGIPVLPVVIDGTRAILPRGHWQLRFRGRVKVKVLPPVHPADFGFDADALNKEVRRRIEGELAGSKAPAELARPVILDNAAS